MSLKALAAVMVVIVLSSSLVSYTVSHSKIPNNSQNPDASNNTHQVNANQNLDNSIPANTITANNSTAPSNVQSTENQTVNKTVPPSSANLILINVTVQTPDVDNYTHYSPVMIHLKHCSGVSFDGEILELYGTDKFINSTINWVVIVHYNVPLRDSNYCRLSFSNGGDNAILYIIDKEKTISIPTSFDKGNYSYNVSFTRDSVGINSSNFVGDNTINFTYNVIDPVNNPHQPMINVTEIHNIEYLNDVPISYIPDWGCD